MWDGPGMVPFLPRLISSQFGTSFDFTIRTSSATCDLREWIKTTYLRSCPPSIPAVFISAEAEARVTVGKGQCFNIPPKPPNFSVSDEPTAPPTCTLNSHSVCAFGGA